MDSRSLTPFVSFRRLGRLGRLGNQFFQVAATIGIARKNRCAYLLPRWEAADQLVPGLVFHDVVPVAPALIEASPAYQEVCVRTSLDLVGFFQNERYFRHCADEIRTLFTPVSELEQAVRERLAPLAKRGPVCSVHVRREDYLGNLGVIDLVNDGYYQRALARLPAGTQFVLCSDDIEWCRWRFRGQPFLFSVGASPIEDLFLMSRCPTHIIANSTLSWWSAWLDPNPNKTVIAPARWYSPAAEQSFRRLGATTGPIDPVPPIWTRV